MHEKVREVRRVIGRQNLDVLGGVPAGSNGAVTRLAVTFVAIVTPKKFEVEVMIKPGYRAVSPAAVLVSACAANKPKSCVWIVAGVLFVRNSVVRGPEASLLRLLVDRRYLSPATSSRVSVV